METIGAAASVMAIVEIVGRVSASATSFMRDIKDARKDMIQVRKDMSGVSTVLNMVAEDLDSRGQGSSSRAGDMPHSQQHTVDIAQSCGAVLLEIETVLRESRSRLGWITSGKERIDRLRARLETCKSSLDVAMDYRTMVVVHDIKVDSTRIVGDVSAIQRDVALLLNKVDNIERTASGGQESPYDTGFPGGVMLDRFLNECRTDAQTVLDNIEYQQDQDFKDCTPPNVAADPSPERTQSSPLPAILFRNSLGYELEIPLDQCRTWAHMEEIIKCSYPHDCADKAEINGGQFTLYHDGQPVPPSSWDDFVGPGRSISLKLCKDDMIDFHDCIGRTYHLPWSLAKTWEGMEDMIKQAFCHVEVIGPNVHEGHYDLIGPDDAVILPVMWAQSIKPGMRISMKMWPSDLSREQATGEAERRHLQYKAMPAQWASRHGQRQPAPAPVPPPERVSQPPRAKDRPSRTTGPPAPQRVRQKQDTGQGPSGTKKTQRSPAPPPHAPKRKEVRDRPAKTTGSPNSQPLKSSSHSRNDGQKST